MSRLVSAPRCVGSGPRIVRRLPIFDNNRALVLVTYLCRRLPLSVPELHDGFIFAAAYDEVNAIHAVRFEYSCLASMRRKKKQQHGFVACLQDNARTKKKRRPLRAMSGNVHSGSTPIP